MRGAPQGPIPGSRAINQFSNLPVGRLAPASSLSAGEPFPVQPEAGDSRMTTDFVRISKQQEVVRSDPRYGILFALFETQKAYP
jgi:hypothetical protein